MSILNYGIKLRFLIREYGSKNIVYFNEIGLFKGACFVTFTVILARF